MYVVGNVSVAVDSGGGGAGIVGDGGDDSGGDRCLLTTPATLPAIDASALPVNHCSQLGVLNRKARGPRRKAHGTHRRRENPLVSRATTQREQYWHIVTDGRNKSE